jgi:hypothetical protein
MALNRGKFLTAERAEVAKFKQDYKFETISNGPKSENSKPFRISISDFEFCFAGILARSNESGVKFFAVNSHEVLPACSYGPLLFA